MSRSVAGYVIVYAPNIERGSFKSFFFVRDSLHGATFSDDINHAYVFTTGYGAEETRSRYPSYNQLGCLPGKLLRVVQTISVTEQPNDTIESGTVESRG